MVAKVLMDLSQAYDSISHDLLIAKLTKILPLKDTLVNFAEEHCTNFILYVELGSIQLLRKQNYLQMSLSTVSLTMCPSYGCL